MSEEMAMLSGRGSTRGDSSQPQQQVIPVDNHRPHMSIDELLEVLKGANATPVLLIPSGDGQLSAIAVNGVENTVTTNREVDGSTGKKFQDFRAWLLLLASLVATVTFTAGLTPPGGFWAADDKANGYVAGTSVMRDKFPMRYKIFHVGNTGAFCFSLMIIGTLAANDNKEVTAFRRYIFPVLVVSCFLSLGTSYISGTWESQLRGVMTTVCSVAVVVYISFCQLIEALFG